VKFFRKNQGYFAFMISLCAVGAMYREVHSVKKRVKRIAAPVKDKVVKAVKALPWSFQGIPYAEEEGLLLSSKKVKVNGVAYPYNGSIIAKKDDSGYYMFFRYDVKKCDVQKESAYALETYIGMAELDENFIHKDHSFKIIDTGTSTSEDPRAFYHNEKMYLCYNDLIPIKSNARSIRIAEIDQKTAKVQFSTNLDLQQQQIEKNWMPFSHGDKLHFVYNVGPHKILKLEDVKSMSLNGIDLPQLPQILSKTWESRWGIIRGGTPAELVDGEYLAFFHSRIRESGTNWYSMGAYTFEASPPFRITRISHHPIFFRDQFDTAHVHTSNEGVKCIFPAGFSVKGDLVHISVGENDASSKVLTLSKSQLFKSLIPVGQPEQPCTEFHTGIE